MVEVLFWVPSTYAATVTSSGLVTLESSDTAALWTGLANMATSILSAFMSLIPYIIPIVAVFIVIWIVRSFIKNR